MYSIYVIRNKINNKIYVGQAVVLKRRWNAHKRAAIRIKLGIMNSKRQVIDLAIAKYGVENFEIMVIEELDTQEETNDSEIFFIEYLQSRNNKIGYNIAVGGSCVGSGINHPCYGKPPANKLFTLKQEKEICARYIDEKLNVDELGKIYNCSGKCIRDVLNRNKVKLNTVYFLRKNFRGGAKKGGSSQFKLLNIEQENEICIKYVNEQLSTCKLAKEYNCSDATIMRVLERYNIKRRIQHQPFTLEQEYDICDKYVNDKFTMNQLVVFYNSSYRRINNVLKKYNIQYISQKPQNKLRKFSPEKEKEICDRYIYDKIKPKQLGKIYGCHRVTIQNILKKYNITSIGQRKFNKEEEYLIYIDYINNTSTKNLIIKYNIDKSTVLRIVNSVKASLKENNILNSNLENIQGEECQK